MKFALIGIACAFILQTTGCATTGDTSADAAPSKSRLCGTKTHDAFVICRTTKAEIISKLGKPYYEGSKGDKTNLIYETQDGGRNFLFDADGILIMSMTMTYVNGKQSWKIDGMK